MADVRVIELNGTELSIKDAKAREDITRFDSQLGDIAKDLLIENGKLYLKKEDGTKIGLGVTLPTDSGEGNTGVDGREIELQKSTDYIQWRYVGDTNWNNLVALADLKVKGDDGLTTSIQLGNNNYKQQNGIIQLPSFLEENNIKNKANKGEFYYNYKQAKAKNAVAIFLDDVNDNLYAKREELKIRGIKITGGIRLDSVSDSGFDPSISSDKGSKPFTTYSHIKELQDDYGIDFAYHGTKHGAHWGVTWDINEDINNFLASTTEHGININGYLGPNGATLPTDSKDKFLWRRNSLRQSGTTTNSDTFFYPENHITIDDIGTDARLEAYKKVIDNLATKKGHVLSMTGHIPGAFTEDNFWALIDYIISKDIDIITATEARMRYGYAIARLPEKTMIDDILGMSGVGNYKLPNYFAMTENGVIKSNYSPIRWIDVSNIATPNINNIKNFELGTTIVSGGSSGNLTGVPTVGTTFINRYGKNGEDFMLYRAYNDAGLYFRDVKTRQRWDKIGIISKTVPTSSTDTGYVGEMAVDTNYLYVCVASNSWIRIAKDSTWK